MSWLVALPVVVPLVGAVLGFAAWRSPRAQSVLGLASATGLLAAGIALVVRVHSLGPASVAFGAWPGPFGIVFVADAISAWLVVLAGAMGLASLVYAVQTVDEQRQARGFFALSLVVLTGVSGAFLTGDLFNLYVWFEVLLVASFVLVVLGGTRTELEAGLRYVVLNLLSSGLFLTGLGLLYGTAGTLNMAHLAQSFPALAASPVVEAAALALLVSFGIKAAVFPLFFWLPSAYTAPPTASSALFAGILTKVGVYAMLRTFTVVVPAKSVLAGDLLPWIAGATMLVGVLGAYAQSEIRQILAYHSISQVGYMVMGIAIGTPLALAGTLFFVVHHSVVKSSLFLVGGLVDRVTGTVELSELGGLVERTPLVAIAFAVSALSLAGVPPLSGFWAKVALVWAGLETGAWGLVVAALATGAVTLLSMTKIWTHAFWGERSGPTTGHVGAWMWLPVIVLAGLAVLLGLGAGPVLDVSMDAARGLLDPEAYVQAALGDPA